MLDSDSNYAVNYAPRLSARPLSEPMEPTKAERGVGGRGRTTLNNSLSVFLPVRADSLCLLVSLLGVSTDGSFRPV